MNNSAYIHQTYRKFDAVLEQYGALIFRTIASAENVYALETPDHLRTPPTEGLALIVPGTKWGEEWSSMWLCTEITVPEEADGKILCAIPETGAVEILCFRDGRPAGIINSKNQFLGGMHSAMFVSHCAKAGEKIALAFECYAGHDCLGHAPYMNYGKDRVIHDFTKTYGGIRLCLLDETMRDFCFDVSTVLQMARLPQNNYVAMKAHECLMNAFPHLIQDVAYVSQDKLREAAAKMLPLLKPALEKKPGGDRSRGYVGVLGHSHMDTAWLWPMSETIRKCARTYSQTLNLMDLYPEYTFIQSSALHLDWMREYYPDIFEGIRQKVAEGRYEPNGGVWVECDCNVTGGESMVRQFLYGQRFTEKYLGYRSDSFWLPDTFGYNGAIPQIMKQSGVDYFYTTKMTWSDLNQFPEDTFVWRGIDGTEVLTHLNRMHLAPDVTTLYGVVDEIRDKYSSDNRLAAYGFGDGGGGPTYGMLEYLKRVKDLDGMPTIEPVTASQFMHRLEERQDKLPLYDGELYLEYHRGTLTQMSKVKKNNRYGEIALRNMELLGVLTGEEDTGKRDRLYRILLQNQFHDILPGTSIPKVYEVTIPEMDGLIAEADAETAAKAASLAQKEDGAISLLNTLSFEAEAPVVLDGRVSLAGIPAQTYTDVTGAEKTVFRAKIPAMGSLCVKTGEAACDSVFQAEGNTLTTPLYHVVFDEAGYITSLRDRRVNREVANTKGAPLGTLWFGENLPSDYDNWEIESDIFRKLSPVRDMLSREVVTDGAVEYRIRTAYRISGTSSAVVDTVFYAEDPRIDYEVKLDWNEKHALLKAGFDVNIRAAFVKNEIQFGHTDRPATKNTSLECARFEICNHKWSDMSESRYGAAILNDCKYGISVDQSDMRLTLQKGCYRPDPITDNGIHTMAYALLPHVGGFSAETVIRPAYVFNYKPVVTCGRLDTAPLFTLDAPNVLCEAVKTAEDRENAYVLRLYECERNDTNCTLTIPGAKKVYAANMLEEISAELPVTDGKVELNFHPFEIKTILVER